MKTTVFNLKAFRRTAYYEDAQALMKSQSRNWMDCYKAKVSAGMAAQAAITSCIEEYQDLSGGDWSFKYASAQSKK
jgi:hypothetical protein